MPLLVKDRYEIVFLATHPLGPKLSPSAIAKYKKTSKHTVLHWIKRYQQKGTVEDERGRGRKPATSQKVDQRIVKLAQGTKRPSSNEIAAALDRRGIQVSTSTIQRRLRSSGMRYGPPLQKPLLTDDHRKQRLRWANKCHQQDWSQVIFTDETTVVLNRPMSRVWQSPGERVIARTVKHPGKMHVWGCFSAEGFGKIYIFTQNMDANLLITIYERALLPSAATMFPDSVKSWLLQEDNDPKHTSRQATTWKVKNGVSRLDWPSQSPDLNPIENVWALLKVNVARRCPRTISSLGAVIKEEWKSLSKEYAKKLVDSMPGRIRAVVEAQGDFILH